MNKVLIPVFSYHMPSVLVFVSILYVWTRYYLTDKMREGLLAHFSVISYSHFICQGQFNLTFFPRSKITFLSLYKYN